MELTFEQGVLFPNVELKARRRSWFRDYMEATKKEGPLATPSMIATGLGVSKQRVHQLLAAGRLDAIEIHGRRYIPVAAFENFLSESRKTGVHVSKMRAWLDAA
jgi:hypothetical protein